ncbi:uncharacterized protein LOC105210892 [Zeugodacus cucurbitae]|uniref:uncharacterized protein LOC105210892 n=1 Tax=Zeugodacus cucurbitae TaxID=28588 RepID=UPI0023D923D2|nr:uncharacterized protein LOC105210892 [Zeugodacus cucurbitae]
MLWHNNKLFITSFAVVLLLGGVAAQDKNITCINCDKTDNCLKTPTATDITTCDAKTCFTRINDDQSISRGCLEESKVNECKEPNCISCTVGDKCNNQSICKSCNSDDDAKCAQTDATTAKQAICAKAETKCLVSVLQKKTERGCATEDNEKACTDEKTCKLCTGGACNVGIFPENRRKCFQCAETNADCANIKADSATLPCTQYVENDTCYMYASNETHVTRGCTSDVGEQNKCAKADDAKCKTCNANDCNNLSYKTEQTLKCVQCSDKDKCAWGQQASSAKVCEQKILYTSVGKCYTRTDADDVITRGCFYDLDEAGQKACDAGTSCTTCTDPNGCNNADGKSFTCIRCRSDRNQDCYAKADTIKGEKCTNAVESSADMKCFTGMWMPNVVIRGCLIDLEPRDQYICNNPKDETCTVCDSTNCNNKENSAAYLFLTNGLLPAVLFTLWRMK